MTDVVLLLAAGIVGGLTGSIAGLASVATYPALLVVGLPPVTANVTNTVALVFNGIGSVWGSRPELAGGRAWIIRVVPFAALGGVAGAVLLLSIPPEGFENSVPILLAIAALAIALPRRTNGERIGRSPSRLLALQAGAVFLVSIYSGYFGAAAGVLLLAVLLNLSDATLATANAGKNLTLGVANAVAAVVFAVLAPVQWAAVLPLGAGCLIGSRLGPVVVRHAPATPLRLVIAASGLALAVKLGLDTYM